MRISHLSLHSASRWMLLMLNNVWLARINIISPVNGAMNESDDRGGEVWNTCRRTDQKNAIVLPTINLKIKDFDSHIYTNIVWTPVKRTKSGRQPCSNSQACKLLFYEDLDPEQMPVLFKMDLNLFIHKLMDFNEKRRRIKPWYLAEREAVRETK